MESTENYTIKISKDEWKIDLNDFFHSVFICPDWIESVQTTSFVPIYLDIYSGGNKIGKISGLIDHIGITKGSQLYFYAGPALKTLKQNLYNTCLSEIYRFGKKNNYSRIIIGSYDNKHSLEPVCAKFYKTERVEYVVPLNEKDHSIDKSKRFKRNVKNAKKLNPNTYKSQEVKELKLLKELLNNTLSLRVKKYKKPYSPYYLKNLNDESLIKLLKSGFAHIYYTCCNGSINCMEFNLENKTSTYMLLKGTNDFGYRNGLSSYLSNYLIDLYTHIKKNHYNQGGRPSTNDGDGLAVFKKSMGAKELISYGATTNYIIWPHKILNPILLIGRRLPQNNIFIQILKRFL